MTLFSYIIITLLLAAGSAVMINGIILTFTTNMNLGNILQLLLGILLLGYGIFYRYISNHFPLWLKTGCFLIILVFIVSSLSLIIYGSTDTVTYDEDFVIILGAGLSGSVPGKTLEGRLDTALEYYKQNPDVIFVVSGGQGPQETVSEAEAMAKYLIDNGVHTKNIIIEDDSTSTRENFEYSKKELDSFSGNEYSVAFITNEFHIYRAELYAKRAGFENAAHIHSVSRIGGLLSSCLRECLAVLKLWVMGV